MTIGILAGGHSRRMGRDKASLKVGDETFLEHTVRLAQTTGLRVMVIGKPAPNDFPFPNVDFLEDQSPDMGPLGGLITGLRSAGTSLLLLPCDMPFLTVDAVGWLLTSAKELAANPTLHGHISRSQKGIEPLFSVYAFSALHLAEEQMRSGNLAMRNFIAAGNFAFIDIPEEHVSAVHNVNRSEDIGRT